MSSHKLCSPYWRCMHSTHAHSSSTMSFDKFNLCIFMAWRLVSDCCVHLAESSALLCTACKSPGELRIADISDDAQRHSLHSTHLSLSMFLWMGFLLQFICSDAGARAMQRFLCTYTYFILCEFNFLRQFDSYGAAGISIKKRTNERTQKILIDTIFPPETIYVFVVWVYDR